jgi:hypothetical protein
MNKAILHFSVDFSPKSGYIQEVGMPTIENIGFKN